jgi:hypothetical protein
MWCWSLTASIFAFAEVVTMLRGWTRLEVSLLYFMYVFRAVNCVGRNKTAERLEGDTGISLHKSNEVLRISPEYIQPTVLSSFYRTNGLHGSSVGILTKIVPPLECLGSMLKRGKGAETMSVEEEKRMAGSREYYD